MCFIKSVPVLTLPSGGKQNNELGFKRLEKRNLELKHCTNKIKFQKY